MSERASVYLTNQTECLEHAIDFFLDQKTGYCRTLNEKRAVFLSQLDFWDWEMDNLIYSFDTFSERSKKWKSIGSLMESLHKQGLMVRNGVVQDLEAKRYRRDNSCRVVLVDNAEDSSDYNFVYLSPKSQTEVVAPVDQLNKTIKKWNKLLDLCEETILEKKSQVEHAVKLGADYQINLNKYKKSLK